MADYNSSYTGTEIDKVVGYGINVTSDIQAQINSKENTLTKGNLTELTSSILTIAGGTNAVIGSGLTITVKEASALQNGYLSSTDWNTFNNKENSLDKSNIVGTGNQVSVTSNTDSIIGNTPITLSLPQSIDIGADVTFGSLILADLTASRAAIINGSKNITHSDTTSDEISYLSGTTSSVQNQLNSKQKELWKTVDTSGNGDYTSLKTAIDANETRIYVKTGTYLEATPIEITNDNTVILGENIDDTIFQFGYGEDGIRIYANYCKLQNFTMDAVTNTSAAACVLGDGQSTGSPNTAIGNCNIIDHCIIKGTSSTFALYIAGASYYAGTPTLQAFEANDLQYNNRITNCILESSWDGDAFSFSLQKDSVISNNYCSGARIAFYMCRDSECCNNSIIDSANQGIFVGCPAYNNVFNNNRIYNSTSSSIKVQNQLEHTPLLDGQGGNNNTFNNNTIYASNNSGFEVTGDTDHEPKGNNFNNNTIFKPDNHGFYIQDSHFNNFIGNTIYQPRTDSGTYSRGSGFYLVQNVENNNINDNQIIDERNPFVLHAAIANREGTDCPSNNVIGNKIVANNTERTVWVQSSGWNISDNYISGGYYAGIYLDGADSCNISGNICENNTNETNNAYYEIWLNNTANNNVITNNTCISSASNIAASNIIVSSGSGNIIENNIGIGTTAEYASILSGLQDMGTGTGIIAQTGNTSFSKRTITGTANQIIVTNGDGVSGDPTLSLPQNIATTSSPTFATGTTIQTNADALTLFNIKNTTDGVNSQVITRLESNNSQYIDLRLTSESYVGSGIYTADTAMIYSSGTSGGLRILTSDATDLILGTNNSSAINIDSNQLVNIGESSNAKLNVNADSTTDYLCNLKYDVDSGDEAYKTLVSLGLSAIASSEGKTKSYSLAIEKPSGTKQHADLTLYKHAHYYATTPLSVDDTDIVEIVRFKGLGTVQFAQNVEIIREFSSPVYLSIENSDTISGSATAEVDVDSSKFVHFCDGYTTSGLEVADSTALLSNGATQGLRIFTKDAYSLILGTNNAVALTFNSSQVATFSASVDCGSSCEADAYTVGGTAGVDFSGAITNLTIVKGIITAAS